VSQKHHARHSWRSLYIYPTCELDDFVTRRFYSVARTVSELPLFFVRYRDSLGKHIRLRVRADVKFEREAETLFLGLGIEAHFSSPPRCRHRLLKNSGGGFARWVRYRPEIARYGGPSSIALAEQTFAASTRAVLSYSPQLVNDPRMIMSLAAIPVAHVLTAPEFRRITPTLTEAFLKSAEQRAEMCIGSAAVTLLPRAFDFDPAYWVSAIAAAARIRTANGPTASFLEHLERAANVDYGDRGAATRVILSQLHMHSNRLGLNAWQESMVLWAVAKAKSQN